MRIGDLLCGCSTTARGSFNECLSERLHAGLHLSRHTYSGLSCRMMVRWAVFIDAYCFLEADFVVYTLPKLHLRSTLRVAFCGLIARTRILYWCTQNERERKEREKTGKKEKKRRKRRKRKGRKRKGRKRKKCLWNM